MRTTVRTRARQLAAATLITGSVFAGGLALAPAANAAGFEYYTVKATGPLDCFTQRAAKIDQLKKLGYQVDPGGCTSIGDVYIAKIAYWGRA